MTVTPARADLGPHAAATRPESAALVAGLRDLLGARLVAYLGGVKETGPRGRGPTAPANLPART